MTTEAVFLHRLTRATAGLLENIAEDVFDEEVDAQRLDGYLEASGNLMVLAVCGDEVVGQVAAYLQHHPDQNPALYVDNLGVSPLFQRRGVGRRLVEEAFAWGKAMGCRQAWIVTDADNIAARALYEGMGSEAQSVVMFSYEL